ncbi:hypothetical protein DSY3860 [Desulfitobacterium hafniense Y51]|uniref:Uncharacterized protein n=1 Tax=Desulfitobacterium hafniense (strain Y51) TaxID=138119 RepID=Q24QP3_DESHY|nr:hypothetical protein DSY3860 [Desulfitobacterium hafniense Y51]
MTLPHSTAKLLTYFPPERFVIFEQGKSPDSKSSSSLAFPAPASGSFKGLVLHTVAGLFRLPTGFLINASATLFSIQFLHPIKIFLRYIPPRLVHFELISVTGFFYNVK